MELILGRFDLPPGENLDNGVEFGLPGQPQRKIIGVQGVGGQAGAGGGRVAGRDQRQAEGQNQDK